MKKRRTLIALFLLCACLVMAVGYAQLQSALSITGGVDVTSKNTDLKVVFSDYTIATASEGKVTAAADGTTAARMTVSGISAEDEYVEVTFTIVNNMTDLNACVYEPSVTNNNKTDFTVTTTFVTDTDKDYKTLAPGAETTVTVKVTLERTHTTAANYSFTIGMVTKTPDETPTPAPAE